MKTLSFRAPPALAIAEGATLPNPGIAGVSVWSTTLAAPVFWTGAKWTAGPVISTGSTLSVGPGANGTSYGTAVGSGANGSNFGVVVGGDASGANDGVAVGYSCFGFSSGAAVGSGANGANAGAAVGYGANGGNSGAAVGYAASTNSKDKAVALGYYSRAQRYRELVKSADGAVTCQQSWSMVNWYGNTSDANPIELLLGGTAGQRCLVLANSAYQFQIQVIASLNGGAAASWTVSGAIKRGATAGTTALLPSPIITLTGRDTGAAAWAVAVSADTTNGALTLTVTGALGVRWNAAATLSELRF